MWTLSSSFDTSGFSGYLAPGITRLCSSLTRNAEHTRLLPPILQGTSPVLQGTSRKKDYLILITVYFPKLCFLQIFHDFPTYLIPFSPIISIPLLFPNTLNHQFLNEFRQDWRRLLVLLMVGDVKSPRPRHLPIPMLHKGHLRHIKLAIQATLKQNKTLFPQHYGSKQRDNEMLLTQVMCQIWVRSDDLCAKPCKKIFKDKILH